MWVSFNLEKQEKWEREREQKFVTDIDTKKRTSM